MIAIRVVSRAGETLATPIVARFGDAGGDIGRGADCTLVLPDPERRISRKHLQVTMRAGGAHLRLISTNLLVELNGVPLAPGADVPLEDGSEIRIGPFVLETRADAPARAGAVGGKAADLLAPTQTAVRPSVFHDVLHAASPAPPRAAGAVDLLVGDTASGAAPAPGPDPFGALYAGLGVTPAAARTPEQATLIGALLRETIAGTLGLLATRTIAKRELGAGLTMPQTRENNPLKFSTDVDAALAHLLGPPQRGFIGPLSAVQAAFADLRAHELAMLAGMRAALEAVLARFDPQALEARFASRGVWENIVPANHKARLWDRYAEQHAEIMREVEDDFDSLFGRAFIEAYEKQLARLGRAPGK